LKNSTSLGSPAPALPPSASGRIGDDDAFNIRSSHIFIQSRSNKRNCAGAALDSPFVGVFNSRAIAGRQALTEQRTSPQSRATIAPALLRRGGPASSGVEFCQIYVGIGADADGAVARLTREEQRERICLGAVPSAFSA